MKSTSTAVLDAKRTMPPVAGLQVLLRELKLPGFALHHRAIAEGARKNNWTFEAYLCQLVELEIHDRRKRRVERLRKQSGLPEKSLDNLDQSRLPAIVRQQLAVLCTGAFLRDATNVLAFGLPGRGKTHLLSAIGHALISQGHAVLFRTAALLVQQLLAAKRDLRLEQELKRLDRYEAVIVDDIGYVQQNREEMEIFFTFLAARYERRSVLITSNLVFSQWDRIFKDAMTTAAAIDRVVHRSIILELTGPSVRAEEAQERVRAGQAGSEQPGADPEPPATPKGKKKRATTTKVRRTSTSRRRSA